MYSILVILCDALCKDKYDPWIVWKLSNAKISVATLIFQLKIPGSATYVNV